MNDRSYPRTGIAGRGLGGATDIGCIIHKYKTMPIKNRVDRIEYLREKMAGSIKDRLEYLRGELRGECISTGELAELASLADHIEPGDVELLEAAGVPENLVADRTADRDLIDLAIEQIAKDLANEDTTAIYELLKLLPREFVSGFLREE